MTPDRVANCKVGDIIETLHFGQPTGNIYKVAVEIPYGRRRAYKQFTGEAFTLNMQVCVRKLPADTEGFKL